MSTELIARLPPDQIGGGRVFRPFGKYKTGEILSGDVLRSWPKQNLKALIDQRFLIAWPVGDPQAQPELAAGEEVFIHNRPGTSRYNVIVGRQLNRVPLSKAEAEVLAERYRKPKAEAAA